MVPFAVFVYASDIHGAMVAPPGPGAKRGGRDAPRSDLLADGGVAEAEVVQAMAALGALDEDALGVEGLA